MSVMKLVQVTYEQCRLEFFEEQLAAAKRKLDWAVKHNPDCYAVAEKGEAVAFFEWAVEKAQQEVAADNNVGSKTNADRIRAMSDEKLASYLVTVESRRRGDGGGAIWGLPYVALDWLKQPAEVE